MIEPTPVGTGDRVVVTGAAGFIASHLVDALLAGGHEVIAVDRRSVRLDSTAGANLARAMGHPRLRLHTIELATEDVDHVVAGADTVFHLAAVPGVRSSWGSLFGDYLASNVVATQRLLAACERAGVRRLVFASSSSVYGPVSRPSREDDRPAPISPYGVTKLAAEQLCLAHAGRLDTNVSVVALRYFTVYGPRQRPGMAIEQILTGALTGRDVTLFGDGRQRREFTYVDDVVAATLAAAAAEVPTAVVNVGGGASVTMRDVLDLAHQITGKPIPVTAEAPQAGDVSATEADLTLARRVLGYEPTVGLREGMTRQADWLADLGGSRRTLLVANGYEVSR